MFHVSVMDLKDHGPFKTFKEAFQYLYREIKKIEGPLPAIGLEACTWIVEEGQLPVMFYDAVNLAIDLGILKDGKLVE